MCILVWERPEQNAVDEAEDGGVGADAKGQGQHGGRGEPRAVRQAPQRITGVLQQGHGDLLVVMSADRVSGRGPS